MEKRKIKQAAILAGGLGERLRPLTNDKPKPMVPVGGRPFAEHLIKLLIENGIKEVLFLSGYLHEEISKYFGDGKRLGINIKHLPSDISDHTGDRVRKAVPYLDDQFLLMYGDNYWPLNLLAMEERHAKNQSLVTMAVYANRDGRGEYGAEHDVRISKDNNVIYFGQRIKDGHGMDIGSFIVEKKALNKLSESHHNFQGQFIPLLIQKGKVSAYVTEHPYHAITNIDLLKRTEKFLTPKKIVFLDRDGVINENLDDDYVKNWKEFRFLPGAIDGMKKLFDSGFKIFIVTNQRGIALGLMTQTDLDSIHAKMRSELKKRGVDIAGIYHCPHDDKENCLCRKPKAGMLYNASWDHSIDLTKAFMVGDKNKDMEAGAKAGCKTFMVRKNKTLQNIAEEIIKLTQ